MGVFVFAYRSVNKAPGCCQECAYLGKELIMKMLMYHCQIKLTMKKMSYIIYMANTYSQFIVFIQRAKHGCV